MTVAPRRPTRSRRVVRHRLRPDPVRPGVTPATAGARQGLVGPPPGVDRRCRPTASPQRGIAVAGTAAEALGAALRRRAGRPPSSTHDRQVGVVVLVGLAVALVDPLLGLLAGAGSAVWGSWRARRLAARDAARLVEQLPDVVDLLALAVAGGATPRHAVEAAARHGSGALAAALAEALAATDRTGARLADVLARLPETMGDEIGAVIRPVVAAERYGTPLGPALALVGRDLRDLRRRRREAEIRKVPVRLVFPLVCCTLPAFALLTVVPLLAGSLRRFALP
jgi:tight adherence protein C